MEQAAASMPDWTQVAEPKNDQDQYTRAQQTKTNIWNVICRWFMAYTAHRGTSHAEKLLHKPRLILLPSALFLEERNVKRKLAICLHSSYSQPLSQTGLLPIQSEDWKGRLGSRHTAMAMGEDILLEIMQKIPMGEWGWKKVFCHSSFNVGMGNHAQDISESSCWKKSWRLMA